MRNTLDMYVVYEDPTAPDGQRYSARHWRYEDGRTVPLEMVIWAGTLKAVHAEIPPWLTRIERRDTDDPAVVEVWL